MKQKTLLINLSFLFALCMSAFAIKNWIMGGALHTTKTNNNPDSYMKKVEYMQLDETGKPKIIIQSPVLIHYAKNNSSRFTYPIITLFQQNNNQVHISANRGRSINGTQKILLENNVVIRQRDQTNAALSKLTTDWLTFFPQQNYFSTDAKVNLEQPGVSVTAIGLKGDLKTGEVKLLSHTRGIYDPKNYH